MGVGSMHHRHMADGRRWLRDRSRSRLQGKARVMLSDLSAEIRECYRHAESCAQKAAAQTDEKLKSDFLDLELRWLFLARSYEFTDRLSDFSEESKRRADQRHARE
jgi:hypothetical protein